MKPFHDEQTNSEAGHKEDEEPRHSVKFSRSGRIFTLRSRRSSLVNAKEIPPSLKLCISM